MHAYLRAGLSMVVVLLSAASASAAALITFTRADDLDFFGNFLLAVTTKDTADGLQVGDAVFSHDPNGVAGVINGAHEQNPWGNYFYSGSTNSLDDDNLGQVMNAIEWSQENVNPILTITLDGLTAGNQYKLQLLFQEECCANRYTDITLDGNVIADEFNYPTPNTPPGFAVVEEFTATGPTSQVVFNYPSTGGDHNATISAFTVEALVPEPGSVALLGLGALLIQRRRRA